MGVTQPEHHPAAGTVAIGVAESCTQLYLPGGRGVGLRLLRPGQLPAAIPTWTWWPSRIRAKMQSSQANDLREAFEESDLPIRVDLFLWDELP